MSTKKVDNKEQLIAEKEIKNKIRELSMEADKLTNEMIEMDSRKGQIQERLIQLIGGIAALNDLIRPRDQ